MFKSIGVELYSKELILIHNIVTHDGLKIKVILRSKKRIDKEKHYIGLITQRLKLENETPIGII